jgi:hypothetical protein
MVADKDKNTKKPDFVPISGLWNGKGKVAYSAFVKEGVNVPAGAKLLLFKNPNATAENRQPVLNLVFVVEEPKQ